VVVRIVEVIDVATIKKNIFNRMFLKDRMTISRSMVVIVIESDVFSSICCFVVAIEEHVIVGPRKNTFSYIIFWKKLITMIFSVTYDTRQNTSR
jgi:hypothetical protein